MAREWEDLAGGDLWGLLREDKVMDKKELRQKVISVPGPFPDSDLIWERIETISGFEDSDIVLLYWSIPGEVDTHEFIRRWHGKKKVVPPRVTGDVLELREYSPGYMVEGYRGILEPSGEAPLVRADEIGFAIVPGMAFDVRGGRLGRGKGYYDRLLPSLGCIKAAVAFPHQIVDAVPMERHDVRMDMVITPNNCYLCTFDI